MDHVQSESADFGGLPPSRLEARRYQGQSRRCPFHVLQGRRIKDETGRVVKVVNPRELGCVLAPGHPLLPPVETGGAPRGHMTDEEAFAASRGESAPKYAAEEWYEGSSRDEALRVDFRVGARRGPPKKASAWS